MLTALLLRRRAKRSILFNHPLARRRLPCFCVARRFDLVSFSRGRRSEAHRSLDVKAMFAQSNMRPCYFRYGYDIAVPLQAHKLFHGLRKLAPQNRKYFATFKARGGVRLLQLIEECGIYDSAIYFRLRFILWFLIISTELSVLFLSFVRRVCFKAASESKRKNFGTPKQVEREIGPPLYDRKRFCLVQARFPQTSFFQHLLY